MRPGRPDGRLGVLLVLVLAPIVFVVGMLLLGTDILGVGGPQPRPPAGALYHEGGRVEPEWTTIGCWREKRGLLPDNEACVLSQQGLRPPGEPLPRGTPRVERGEALRFVTVWPHEPERVTARAVRTDVPPDEELAMEQSVSQRGGGGGAHSMPLGLPVEEVPVRREGARTEILLSGLPLGEYLLSVRMDVDDADAVGEVHYDFGIVVEE